MSPYSSVYTNEMIRYIQEEEKNISALILVTNEIVTSNSTYGKPRLISLANIQTGKSLREYSIQKSQEVKTIAIEHSFTNRCEILEPLINSYIFVAISWLAVLIVFWIHTFITMKQYSMTLQRTLMLVPSIKLAETLIIML